ncbi:hypothetical protein [Catellatospora vulcania]|uniref:hypothetical protein n=1 Tax=Catellatospora vulcania TaxID=1460450 RepID=UPI0012D49D23|nr:hypothetical protein [Catellatospora vulcania]
MGSVSRHPIGRTLTALLAAVLLAATSTSAQGAPPPPGSDTDPYNPGIVYRTVYSRPGSPGVVEFGAGCPTGYRPFGGGAQLLGATNQVFIQRTEPVHNVTDNGLYVRAVERPGGYSGTWQLRVIVACGPDYPNLTYLRTTTAVNSTNFKSATVQCPAGLTRVGMGAEINTTSSAVRFDDIGFGIFSNAWVSFPSIPNSARAIAGELPSGTSATWSVSAVVVCATPPPTVAFHGAHHGYGISVVDGEYVYTDNVETEACGGWEQENHSYMTGVGGGQDGDSGEVNLQWYIDPDDYEVGVMQTGLDSGGYSGAPMSTYLSVICVTKT